MRKLLLFILILILLFSSSNVFSTRTVFASPENTLNEISLAEKLLIKLQNKEEEEIEKLYLYFDILCHENTQFFSYKIEEIENLMNAYREDIIKKAREMASNSHYKQAVEYLESKSLLFKDKSTINSLISYYSNFFIKDGLFLCNLKPTIISINKLINNPTLAFAENPKSEEYDNLFLTTKEFSNLLMQLYLNDYILIGINNLVDFSEDIIIKKDLYLPQNKKPLLLILNEANYKDNESSFIEKYIIDSKNEIATFNSKEIEKNQISNSGDFLPILENFINSYKDFSFNSSKCIITFSKNDNILGYNIHKSNPNYSQELTNLKKITQYLKEKGYEFAYSFDFANKTQEDKQAEIDFINSEILDLFPNIKIFSSSNENKTTSYYSKLNNIGFKVFISTGGNYALVKNNMFIIESTKIDGKFLRNPSLLKELDYDKIYDHANRTKLYKI